MLGRLYGGGEGRGHIVSPRAQLVQYGVCLNILHHHKSSQITLEDHKSQSEDHKNTPNQFWKTANHFSKTTEHRKSLLDTANHCLKTTIRHKSLLEDHIELVMGHFFKTQPNQKFLDPTQPIKVFTRPDPTHHRQLFVWHIRL